MAGKKQIQLNFLETASVGGNAFIGQWKEGPHECSRLKDQLEYYIWLAKIAEKGKITSIFFPDSYGVNDVYGGNTDATYRGGCQVAQLDPVVLIPAMAAVTKSVGFAVSANACYLNPYIMARTFSTLDHVTNGRIGWNIVTGYTNASAKAMGFDQIMAHDKRYEKAEELWEGSWDDDAQVWDVENDVAYEPGRIHRIDFEGQFHRLSATQQTHPSRQRVPVLFQAGSSKAGIALAGAHAEGLYCGSMVPSHTAKYVENIRASAAAAGRDPRSVKAFAGISLFLGRTTEEAQAKYDAVAKNVSPIAGLAKFGGYTNVDMSKYPLDEPFEFTANPGSADNVIQGIITNFKAGDGSTETWTPRKLGSKIALGGLYPIFIGTAEQVADSMEDWVAKTDIDGFNLYYCSNPETYEDVVEMLVPELQRRGVYWMDYPVPGGTFRENMYFGETSPRLPDDHPAGKIRLAREAKRQLNDGAGEPKEKAASKLTNGLKNGLTNGHQHHAAERVLFTAKPV
ncbi:hypothetical protein LTR99_000063 [Exophiala xenobiotica]|uniref:Luciferase-like domain-containing protein n=1 Tax=Vermiconidia calcicola TaxID=1690605 RepID=A0AAV9PZN0_9PEZI|nr:hypothetical protein LTR99_000063 [Exophiala xenobiotica]KAK5439099.1 hypothetical protein LTR34_000063 [Exophiala xenobiotica]KAK5530126.1 hypothetical protein LTR25_009372 [Vermiconidia calcicola]KAK5547446.1 hypothetical protein LTR23_002668 [Chaetothyriales sp. CCFEE 6169]